MAKINYEKARMLLNESFSEAEDLLLKETLPPISTNLIQDFDTVFSPSTKSYREVLLGCVIARILNEDIDIHLPYVSHGESACNGRELDEKVVNPFLQDNRVPSTKGPYLSTFRRQAKFNNSTRERLRDKHGYDSLLTPINYMGNVVEKKDLKTFLLYTLFRFVQLREDSIVSLTRVQRLSLDQYKALISKLMNRSSGGLYPMLIATSMFRTIKDFFDLDWEIDWQGINVADSASGVGGDITISDNGNVILAIEVTQREVDRARTVSTFNTKIAPAGLEDYLFLVGATEPTKEAREQASRYFAQGHEINFARINDWIVMLLATMGKRGRTLFTSKLMELLESDDTPSSRKSWLE